MRSIIVSLVLLFGISRLASQSSATQSRTPAFKVQDTQTEKLTPSAIQPVFTGEGGFSFSYPVDWEVVDVKPILPVARMQAQQSAKSALEQKGADCVQIPLMIRHGEPRSVILILYLDYGCVGKSLDQSDLAATGMGISEGITKNFDIPKPIYGAYKLQSHSFWIERGDATSRNHPDKQVTLETTCSMLKKGLVCWLALAATPDAIAALESGKVSLEGDDQVALVPQSVFAAAAK